MRQGTENGFTLIELLIIVAIIGLLASIAFPQYASYRQRSFDGRAQSDLRNIITVEEAYFIDNDSYTSTITDLTSLGFKASPGTALTIALNGITGWSANASHPQGAFKYCFNSDNSLVGIVNIALSAACP